MGVPTVDPAELSRCRKRWLGESELSFRDLPEMFLLRGIEFTYEAVRDWEAKLTPLLIDNLRRRRRGGSRVRHSWYVDET